MPLRASTAPTTVASVLLLAAALLLLAAALPPGYWIGARPSTDGIVDALTAYDSRLNVESTADPVEHARLLWLSRSLARCVDAHPRLTSKTVRVVHEELCADRVLNRVATRSPQLARAYAAELEAVGLPLPERWRGQSVDRVALRLEPLGAELPSGG